MIFRQVVHDDLGCASYFIGDQQAREAAVVDPRLDIDEYLELARYMGVAIRHVLESHNHADHVSGHGRLAAATGAVIHVHREARVDYDHEPFDDGWELAIGRLRVRALHTPGHRPEHTAFLLIDTSRGDEPWAVLTGDTLFINDIARPDLAVEKADGAKGIFHSIHERLLTLPPDTEVWPGHLGGSMCGGPGMDMKICSTIGFEARHNPALRIDDEQEFVESALAGLGQQPPNFRAIVELNRGPLLTEVPSPTPLSPREVAARAQAGALVVDVRTDAEFDDAHAPDAVSISMLRAGFGSKLAWVRDEGQEIVFVGSDDRDGEAAAKLACAVGVTDARGFLKGGMMAWYRERLGVVSTPRLPVADLPRRMRAQPELQVLDVREAAEWRAGHIPDSVSCPWHELTSIPDGLDPRRPIAVVCSSGQRATTAASLLRRLGASSVIHVVDGGAPDWERVSDEARARG